MDRCIGVVKYLHGSGGGSHIACRPLLPFRPLKPLLGRALLSPCSSSSSQHQHQHQQLVSAAEADSTTWLGQALA